MLALVTVVQNLVKATKAKHKNL